MLLLQVSSYFKVMHLLTTHTEMHLSEGNILAILRELLLLSLD